MHRLHFDLRGKEFLILKEPGFPVFSFYVLKPSPKGDILIAPFYGKPLHFETEDVRGYSPETVSEHIIFPDPINENDIVETHKTDYLDKIKAAINVLSAGDLKKVVLSRTKVLRYAISPKNMLLRLAEKYPDACAFCFYTQQTGYWMGATPEYLLDIFEGEVKTASLAGTRKVDSTGAWGEKELEEQRLVTEEIERVFKRTGLENSKRSDLQTKKAGKIEHLFTEIYAQLPKDVFANDLAYALHPTPAVGGLPKAEATDYILKNDGYNRAFYTGYFGLAGTAKTGDAFARLWVNLRSMQLFKNGLVLYAGGGITAASDPQAEWEETERKLQTLIAVI